MILSAAVSAAVRQRRATASAVPPPLPAPLALLAPGGSLVSSRPLAVASSLAARAGLLRGHAVWQDPARPMVVLDLDDATGARWLRQAFEPATRGRRVDPLTWQALRSPAFLAGGGEPVALEAARRALGRELDHPRVALLAPGGGVVKTTFFVTERGRPRPSVVVRMMAEVGRSDWMLREVAGVAALRERLAGHEELLATLPDEPLLVDWIADRTVVVEACNAIAAPTDGRVDALAASWLARLQDATTLDPRPLSAREERAIVATVQRAFGARSGELLASLEQHLHALRGRPLGRCAVHGDFWHGNVSMQGSGLRVYDWEWSQPDGLSAFDHATWELGALIGSDDAGSTHALAQAQARLADRFVGAGVPVEFAPVALVYCAAEWSTRVEREFGREGAFGLTAAPMLAALRPLLRYDETPTRRAA